MVAANSSVSRPVMISILGVSLGIGACLGVSLGPHGCAQCPVELGGPSTVVDSLSCPVLQSKRILGLRRRRCGYD
jgi:hypothetical protein